MRARLGVLGLLGCLLHCANLSALLGPLELGAELRNAPGMHVAAIIGALRLSLSLLLVA